MRFSRRLIAGGAAVFALTSGASRSGPAQKALTRTLDPVAAECRGCSPLFGTPVDRLALMALREGEWRPIPFQVDEKLPDGTYAFPEGPKPSHDPDPRLDENDEIVFMARDAGDRAGPKSMPEAAAGGVEIEIEDSEHGGKGWVYLFSFPKSAPRSPVDLVKFSHDSSAHRIRVVTTQVLMEGPDDRLYPDVIAQVGPDGKPGLDVLDRLKIRGSFVLPLGVEIPFIMDEWTKVRIVAWRDGPVRALVLFQGYLELSRFIKFEGSGYSILYYYDNHVIWPMFVETPVDLRGIIKKTKLKGFMDFNRNVYGSHPFSAANPYSAQVVMDGKMNPAEKNLDRESEIDWIAGFGPQGAMVTRLVFPPEWSVVKKLPYYLDDETVSDPPEDDPGVCGVGYDLVGFEKLGKQSTTYYQYYYYVRHLDPEDVPRFLDILDHPLKVYFRGLSAGNHGT